MKIFTFELLFSAFLKEVVFSTYNITILDEFCDDEYKIITLHNKGRSSAVVFENMRLANTIISCERIVEAPFDGKVLVSVRKYNIPGPCILLKLEVKTYANMTTPISSTTFCKNNGSIETDYVYETPVIFAINGEVIAQNSTSVIEVLLVAFQQEPCGGYYNFKCPKGVCIDSCLVCDGYSHCSDNSDENEDICSSYTCPYEGSNVGIVLGIVFGSLMAIVAISAAVWVILKKRPFAVKEGAAEEDSAKADATPDDSAAKGKAAPGKKETTTS